MLESMPRPAADEPNIFGARMPIDQKISARSIFVLANARLDDRRIAQRREPPRHVFSHLVCRGLADNARLRVWIDDRSVAVERNLESARLDIRHSVSFIILKHESWKRRRSKPRVAGRHSEKINLLPRRENPLAKHVGKKLAEPRAARKNKNIGLKFFPTAQSNRRN